MDQFIKLWTLVQDVNLIASRDHISWKVATDGVYSASSAYAIQFCGRLRMLELQQDWMIKAQGNVKLFF